MVRAAQSQTVTVQLDGDTLEVCGTCRENAQVSVRHVCKALGLDVRRQLQKLRDSKWATVEMIYMVAGNGKSCKMAVIPLQQLPLWLMDIEPRRVKEEFREKLDLYKVQAMKVLAVALVNQGAGQQLDLSPVAQHQRLHKAESPRYGQVLIFIGPDGVGRVELSAICRVLGVNDETIDPDGTDLAWLPEAAFSLVRAQVPDSDAVAWCPMVRTAEGEALLDLFSAMVLFASARNWVPGLDAKRTDLCNFLSWVGDQTRNATVVMNWNSFNARAMASDYKSPPLPKWVYFLRDPSRRIKIGISTNPHQRMKGMLTGNPERLELLGVIPNATQETERDLHEKFAHLRLTGEWFRECEELLAYVAKNTEKMPAPEPKRRRKAKV